MTEKKQKAGVLIMRGQIVTLAHTELIQYLIDTYRYPMVLIGSANCSRSERNPFTFSERKEMIESIFGDDVTVGAIPDFLYNDNRWVAEVHRRVHQEFPELDVAVVGHDKDDTTFYLKMFPGWELDLRPKTKVDVSATDVRNIFFGENWSEFAPLDKFVSPEVCSWLNSFRKKDVFKWLVNEYAANKKSRDLWKNAPYTPTFNTVDAVVTQAGNILLVERKNFPGQGLMALPGGYLNPGENLVDGMIRELKEETKLKVPVPVLKGSIVSEKTFADPNRSSRGRILTQAFHIDLRPDFPLPKVQGSDDAFKAFWYPLWKIRPNELFEDHAAIISHFTRVI